MDAVTLGMVLEARERLRGVVRRTDLVPSMVLGQLGVREVYLKTECLQHTGSFKVRGAYNKIAQLSPDERDRGVIAASAGNHAQGVARAAKAFKVSSIIVMPEGAPLAKIDATRALGAEVVLNGLAYDDACAHALSIASERGMAFIHPFDDPLVIAGQGSVGLEIMDDLPDVDAIFVPIGGGGLAAGVAVAVKALKPHVKIIGVEAQGAPSMRMSEMAGKIVTLDRVKTIADGIAVKTPGQYTYDICSKLLDDVVTVDDDEIANTILLLLEKCKIVSEGAGATAVAAILHDKTYVTGKIAAIVSGGNIDVTTLQRIIDKGLIKAGRLAEIQTVIEDKPGRLYHLLKIISLSGANVVSIQHDRTILSAGVGSAMLHLTLETHNQSHLDTVVEMMREGGYLVEITS